MGWVDTHCHLQLTEDPPGELLDRAPEVDWLVVPGIDAPSSRAALELADAHPDRLLATAGLHPHEAEAWPDQAIEIRDLASRAAAVGETGLDYYRDLSPREAQRRSFAAHLELAAELDKPVVVHCRDAFADVWAMLSDHQAGPRAVLHCWTGGPRWTRRFRELGVTFSFAGPVAFETGDTVRRAAAEAPRDRTMVETDTPYLAPPPHRGEANQPAWVTLVGEALARVWDVDPVEAADATSRRAAEVFGRPEART